MHLTRGAKGYPICINSLQNMIAPHRYCLKLTHIVQEQGIDLSLKIFVSMQA